MEPNDTTASRSYKVWVVGNRHPAADRSVSWNEDFPNMSEPDVLILDLTTLTSDMLKSIFDKDNWHQAADLIMDKFVQGDGIIIVITVPCLSIPNCISNYFLAPVEVLNTTDVPHSSTIKPDKDHEFAMYLASIEKFTFYITDYNYGKINHKIKYCGHSGVSCTITDKGNVYDNASHYLGSTFMLLEQDYSLDQIKSMDGAGKMVLLPPPTEPLTDALGKILFVYGKTSPIAGVRPNWAENIRMPRANNLQNQIDLLTSKNHDIVNEIKKLKIEREKIMDHTRLLYSGDLELEDAVRNAFQNLGFTEIRQIRDNAFEDGIFEFNNERFKYGVIEIKGATKRTTERDLTQCSKWVDQLFEIDQKLSKGIFIPNQYRIRPYVKSSKERKKFEPNEIDYATMKGICIIPSCVLFEAVCRVLGGETPNRTKIEQKIIDTNGVLENLL